MTIDNRYPDALIRTVAIREMRHELQMAQPLMSQRLAVGMAGTIENKRFTAQNTLAFLVSLSLYELGLKQKFTSQAAVQLVNRWDNYNNGGDRIITKGGEIASIETLSPEKLATEVMVVSTRQVQDYNPQVAVGFNTLTDQVTEVKDGTYTVRLDAPWERMLELQWYLGSMSVPKDDLPAIDTEKYGISPTHRQSFSENQRLRGSTYPAEA